MEVKTSHGEGNHVCFDCIGCDKETLDNKEEILEFLNNLPDIIGMKKISESVVVKHEHENNNESGTDKTICCKK